MNAKRIAIFASGSGSNTQSIIEYFQQKESIEVALIMCNKSNAFVVQRAKKLGVKCFVFNSDTFKNNLGFLDVLSKYKVSWIILAGFLLKIPEYVIEQYQGKIINIHPALLPKYGGKGMYGANVHEAVLENKELQSGISIHYVNKNYDEGKIIFQASCSISPEDSLEDLSNKIQQLEHLHYPRVIEETIINSDK
ncbi:phosphoribosylglycinamide formyltransferase [Flavobacteriales bacterium]|nr:phosphoribosylglycinamide formyltransferase [Flavobacteriales bacterium]